MLAAALFLVVRPLATVITLSRTGLSPTQRAFVAWFGVRGIGSIYYLAYATAHGLATAEARVLVDLTLVVIATSIVVHGVSVTPLMKRYARTAEAHTSVESYLSESASGYRSPVPPKE
jgi:NhaP-type Na+/H+ or K+/H+ antiporter